MFNNKDLYPTPVHVIDILCEGLNLSGKTILDPSAGTGSILKYAMQQGAKEALGCENNQMCIDILKSKFRLIGEDFLQVKSEDISHIDLIIMNPPFSADEKHIIHAFNIAPDGCKIHALCNYQSIKNNYSSYRKEFKGIIDNHGTYENLGDCFNDAERKTDVQIGLVKLLKPAKSYESEFDGFFIEEEQEMQANGIMSYNIVRDLVNRYVASIKIYDEQMETAVKLNELQKGFFNDGSQKETLSVSVSRESVPLQRNQFKKSMQKSGWNFIFKKLNMEKYATKGLKEDINKFVEQQSHIPFTMRNIYKMIDIVVGTQSQRMDKALLEVFDKITSLDDDNKHNVEGWKTNSHYLVNQKFIMPWIAHQDWGNKMNVRHGGSSSNVDIVEDFVKALCYIDGKNYSDMMKMVDFVQYRYKLKNGDKYILDPYYDFPVHCKENELTRIQETQKRLHDKGIRAEIEDCSPKWGEWFDWGFFRVKGFKKGTMHFEFKDLDLWAKYNQHVARLKGYPLFESKGQTKWQKRQNKKAA